MRGNLLLACAALFAIACHREAAPLHPESDVADKPSSTGTPIGYLIDSAAPLQLHDDQIASLRTIDADLATQLRKIDKQLAAASGPPGGSSSSASDGGGGMPRGGGGRGGRGMGGRGGAGASGGGDRRGGASSGGGQRSSRGGGSDSLLQERVAGVRDAVKKAFALMDPAQQERSKKILDDHNVDYGQDEESAAAAEPPPIVKATSCTPGSATYLGFRGNGPPPPVLLREIRARFADAVVVEVGPGTLGVVIAEPHSMEVRARHEAAAAAVGWKGDVVDFPSVAADCSLAFHTLPPPP